MVYKYNQLIPIPKTKSVGVGLNRSLAVKILRDRGDAGLFYYDSKYTNVFGVTCHKLRINPKQGGITAVFSDRDMTGGVINNVGW